MLSDFLNISLFFILYISLHIPTPKANAVFYSKSLIFSFSLFEIIYMKVNDSRLSLTPYLIKFSNRFFIANIILGLCGSKIYSDRIYKMWILMDLLLFARSYTKINLAGIVLYYLAPPLHFIASFWEIMSIYQLSRNECFMKKYLFRYIMAAYLLNLSIVFKYKKRQLCRFRNSSTIIHKKIVSFGPEAQVISGFL